MTACSSRVRADSLGSLFGLIDGVGFVFLRRVISRYKILLQKLPRPMNFCHLFRIYDK